MDGSATWYPLSYGQEALWFLWKLAPRSWAYNIPLAVGVRGELDPAALQRSLQTLSDRHPCLRMAFREEGGQPSQRPIGRHQVQLNTVDAFRWSEAQLQDALRDGARSPFDPAAAAGAALRGTLFRRDHNRHELLIVVHHIASDLWSLVVLMDELRQLYAAEKAGTGWSLPPLPLRYEDYVHWQRQLLEGKAGERLWSYWQEELAGELPVLDLPTDHPRPPLQSFRGGTVTRKVDACLAGAQRDLAGKEGATLFMVLLAAFQILLHRYTGQECVMVGTPTSGRHRPELSDLIGDFVNMVALRGDLAGQPTFSQVLGQVRRQVVGALKHQDYPLSLLVDRLHLARDPSRSPIFQTSFVLQKFQRYEELSRMLLPGKDELTIPFADLELVPRPLAQQDGQFDLNLEIKEDDVGGLMCAWKYSTDLFEAATIERMAGHFETLLSEIASHPKRSVAELRLLAPEQSRESITDGHGATVELPAAASVYELFAAQAERCGTAIAVRCGEDSLTYAELSDRVTRLAGSLAMLGVGPEVLVAVLLTRGLDFVTTLLAVSRAGGAFLPLDPRHPLPRNLQILESSGVRLVLSTKSIVEQAHDATSDLGGAGRRRVVAIEDLARQRACEPAARVDGGNLAYVMYTSGSTGSPKGVMVEHLGMVNHFLAKLSDLGMGADDALAQNGPQSFDIVVWQCLAPLVVGGRVEVFPDDIAENPEALMAAVERCGVTVLQLVPSMLQAVLDEAKAPGGEAPPLGKLRWMVPTGEALPTELCRRWLAIYPSIRILNTYGSTECSDDQCHYVLSVVEQADDAVALVSIGRPVHNMSAHVLDENLAPVPVGVVGELYIGGVGVGRGYLNDPVRTAASFIADPFSDRPGARLYRTRDLARRRADLALDFLGRVDHMIKLRGFRIEPGEIEAALCQHPVISEAAVLARDHPSGERQLVGYVVAPGGAPDDPPDAENIRQFLTDRLPRYMVPTAFCFCDALPLTANGKLDLRRLPDPEWEAARSEQFEAPRTATEKKMADIWAEVLGLERVGVRDNFFAIGGDSIRSIQIVARFNRAGLQVRPGDLFLHQTIPALAALADRNGPPASGDGEAAPVLAPPELQVSREHLELAHAQVNFDSE